MRGFIVKIANNFNLEQNENPYMCYSRLFQPAHDIKTKLLRHRFNVLTSFKDVSMYFVL